MVILKKEYRKLAGPKLPILVHAKDLDKIPAEKLKCYEALVYPKL